MTTPTPSTKLSPIRLRVEDPPEVQVRFLVQSYNRAVREVFGECAGSWVRLPEDATRSKLYPRLRAAAEACVKHDIPPSAWAVWALGVSHAMQTRQGKTPKPGPIVAVFSATYITNRRGWFRRESKHTYGQALQVERLHLEQHFRRREALRAGVLAFFPRWYVTIREEEIAQGVLDPLERMPHDPSQPKVRKPVKPMKPEELV